MKLSLCIVGCGSYAANVLTKIHDMTDEFDFYFASRDLQKAKEYCERFGGIDSFGSYEEALADPRVQAAYFFTPHHVHLDNTRLAAQHGKNILMEKPIARTIEESQLLVQTARDAGVQLMVAENFRFLHTARRARSMIETGTLGSIGDLRLIDIKVEAFRPPSSPWRYHADLTGGGSFIDAGIHYIDLILYLGGMPTQVYAAAPTKVHRQSEGEDGLVLLANLPNDAVAVFNFSRATSRNEDCNLVGITGTKGYIEFQPYGREITFENTLVKRNVRLPEAHRGAREMVREFRDSIQQQRPPLMTGDEAIKDLAVVLAAYRSAAESRHVPLSEFNLSSD
ncbi:MAG: Gfo/Idh/MocA family oxidoreductase [Chloroflexi bacterium]|nr:Gfo/Idh/MocA family oxidoreductase [Chloroflexota bacterium]